MKLLNIDSNPKTIKGQKQGFLTAILYLAPSDLSGTQLCPTAMLAGCSATCLNTAGRGGMAAKNATMTAPNGTQIPDNTVQRARLARTAMFLKDQPAFMAQLVMEITAFIKKARKKGLIPAVRLNGTSDIRWENEFIQENNLFELFRTTQFYDYTKIPNRKVSHIANYHLTFSYSHRPEYAPIVIKALKHYGQNVNFAAVFHGAQPESFLGRNVINGDESDLRFLDMPGVTVALTAKGRAKKDMGGFVVRQ